MNRSFITTLLAILLVFTIINPVSAANSSVKLAEEAKSAVLIEQDSGKILYSKNENVKLPPASMTKIMTLLLIMEKIEDGSIKLNEKVRASEYAASMGGSQIFLEPGEEMTVDELLRGIAVASGNDASVVMAERIAGTEDEFVKLMNKKAKELGLKNTTFKNTTGLPADGHVSTSYDMAIMARELLKYEQVTKYTGLYEDYLRQNTDNKFWLVNTNKLVKFYPGCDGLKTGFTTEARYCLTATAKRNDMRVVGVIMGAPTSKVRNAQMTKMLDYAFAQYSVKPIYKKNQVLQKVKISKGSRQTVDVLVPSKVSIVLKKGEKIGKLESVIKVQETVKAPVKKGQELGTLEIRSKTKVYVKTKIVAAEDINEASYFDLFKRTLGNLSGK
ncbi:MAG: Serine-type D-Ala-D-Ala carboxypeptidase [Bacillales bacterium]|nr:Serine-type D-Ala-D-Ala carboxypeptidase [Bacillales bacterium]